MSKAEEFLNSKDIWNHPRVSNRDETQSYDLAELLKEFADEQLRLRIVTQQSELLTGFVRFERLQDYKYKLLPLSEKIKKYIASL